MGNKTILLAVPNVQMSIDITEALGADWQTTSTTSEAEAMAELEKCQFDAILADFNLGSDDASELLDFASQKRPDTIRFLLAYEADLALVAAKVTGSHELLPKPFEPASLKSRIEEGVASEETNTKVESESAAAAPAIPPIYADVLKALEAPGVTTKQVAKIIDRDSDLKDEILKLANATFLGLPRNLTEPVQAVEFLGLDTVKALVMALRYLSEHGNLRPGYLSFDQMWHHSINVAQLARDLVLFETKDRKLAQEAFMAGLLHDLGKVVLVQNFDDLYGRVYSLARKQPVALWDIEKEMFGANHGEIGACLVGMWNLPAPVVEAAALHHEPPMGEQQQLTPLAAVHIANVLEHELRPGDECRIGPVISTPYVNELGLLHRLPVWRAAFANRTAPEPEHEPEVESDEMTETESTPEPQTTAAARQPRGSERNSTIRRSISRPRRWVYGGLAAGALAVLALWFASQVETDDPVRVFARTPDSQAIAAPGPATTPASAPEVKRTETVKSAVESPKTVPEPPKPEFAKSAAAKPEPEPAKPDVESLKSASVSEPAPSPAPQVTSASVASPIVMPKEPSAPEYRLSGIIYSSSRPSAIINGTPVFAGDSVNGAKVLSVGRNTVTLEVGGQLRTITLR